MMLDLMKHLLKDIFMMTISWPIKSYMKILLAIIASVYKTIYNSKVGWQITKCANVDKIYSTILHH